MVPFHRGHCTTRKAAFSFALWMVTIQIYLALSHHLNTSTQPHWIYGYAHKAGRKKQKAGSLVQMQRMQLHTPWLALTVTEKYLLF